MALQKLTTPGPLGVLYRWLNGPLRGVADIYIPYRIYKVTVEVNGASSERYYAVDAAAGTLDPYEFSALPEQEGWIEVGTRNFHPIGIEESETKQLVMDKVRRLLFSRGCFRLVNPQITAEFIQPEFYVPYWIGFYGNEQSVRITVLNAVRQTIEGGKVRQLVEAWMRGPRRMHA